MNTETTTCSDLVGELVKRWPNRDGETHPQKKLLIIDDNADYCTLFRKAFEKYGYYDTHEALTGEDGLNIFRREQPFLAVFLDLSLPGIDGIEVFDRIREMNPLQYVVIITGAMTEEYAAKLKRFFCYGVAFKPVDFNVMAAILHTHINPPVG